MNNLLHQTFLIFVVFAVIFFIVSFQKQIWKTIIFNLIFLTVLYISIGNLLGEAKPINFLPFYNHAPWDDQGVYVVGGYWDENNIYLLLKEDRVRLYRWPMDQRFLSEIKKTQEKNQRVTGDRWNFILKSLGGSGRGGGSFNPENFSPEPTEPPHMEDDPDLKKPPAPPSPSNPNYIPGSSDTSDIPQEVEIK